MGAPMARNALKAGFAVTVTNRTLSRAEPLGKDDRSHRRSRRRAGVQARESGGRGHQQPGCLGSARVRRVAGHRSRKDTSGHRRWRGIVMGDEQLRAEDARRRLPRGVHDRPAAEGPAPCSRQRLRRPHLPPRRGTRARALQRAAERWRGPRGEPRAHQGHRAAVEDRGARTVLTFDRALARLSRLVDLDVPWQWLPKAKADARYALYNALEDEQKAAAAMPAALTEPARILELAQVAFRRLPGLLAAVDAELR